MIDPNRRQFSAAMLAAAASAVGCDSPPTVRSEVRPNFIVILADDLGIGDLGCYGGTLVRTPNIDRLATTSVRFTEAYAAANLCTPSRAGLLTGRYPIRTGLANEVILPDQSYGLPAGERTIAALLKPYGYATALIGKWHLGNRTPYSPPAQAYGFDRVFGVPSGNEERPLEVIDSNNASQPDADPALLTAQFHREALRFMDEHHRVPFFLYLAHTSPHLPLDPNPAFKGRSWAHAYGDVVEEIDDGVSRIMRRLVELGIDHRTMVILTSDNGPWFEGDAGGLHGRKGDAGFDGGYRVPLIVRLPRATKVAQTTDAITMGIDLLPTMLHYAGVPLPADCEIDGLSLHGVLEQNSTSPHDELVLFDNAEVAGIRTQRWKLVTRFNYRVYNYAFSSARPNYPPLFDLRNDPLERYNAAATFPRVWADMKARADAAVKRFEPLKAQQQGQAVRGG